MATTYKFGYASSVIPGGTAVVDWGDIGGMLADQTDLGLALGAKQDTVTGAATTVVTSDLTASRILQSDASGKIAVVDIATYPSLTELSYVKGVTSGIQAQINGKQATLVSGTNIKTVNSNSLLGSGDVVISALPEALTGLTPAVGLTTATDTVLQGFGKLANFARYATVAEAEAATGRDGAVVFVHETEKWYKYHAVCSLARDGSLVLNTGLGGTTRWEAMDLSHRFGATGWVSTDNATITALSSTTVRLTLASAGVYAIKGVRYELAAGNYDVVLSGTATPKFIGINESGVLYHQDTLWDFESQCPVALAYWTGTAIAAAPQTEFHGLRDTVWHHYAHTYQGLQYRSGLTFTGNVQTDNNTNPGVDTVQYLWATDGVVQDEDVQSTPGTGQWAQTLGSGLTSATAGIFNFFYFNGTFITTLAAMADRCPFIYNGANGTPRWNSGGTLTDSVTGDYVVYHYFATPMVGGWAVFARPHNAVFSSLGAAQQARPSQLTWSNYAELKHIYTAIWRVNTGWTTITHRCKLVSLQDFRTVAGGPVAGTSATDHNALSNRGVTFSHPASAVYGTRDGGIQYHDTASNGLLSDDNFLWNKTTKRFRCANATVPTSATDTGDKGAICWDSDFIYVCTATDQWKRAALSTWP